MRSSDDRPNDSLSSQAACTLALNISRVFTNKQALARSSRKSLPAGDKSMPAVGREGGRTANSDGNGISASIGLGVFISYGEGRRQAGRQAVGRDGSIRTKITRR